MSRSPVLHLKWVLNRGASAGSSAASSVAVGPLSLSGPAGWLRASTSGQSWAACLLTAGSNVHVLLAVFFWGFFDG